MQILWVYFKKNFSIYLQRQNRYFAGFGVKNLLDLYECKKKCKNLQNIHKKLKNPFGKAPKNRGEIHPAQVANRIFKNESVLQK